MLTNVIVVIVIIGAAIAAILLSKKGKAKGDKEPPTGSQ